MNVLVTGDYAYGQRLVDIKNQQYGIFYDDIKELSKIQMFQS